METNIKKYPVTDGARALVEYLSRNGLTISGFCEAHGLDRIAVQRAISGERRRISVDLAASIENATSGNVDALLWTSWTGRLEAKRDRRKPTGTC